LILEEQSLRPSVQIRAPFRFSSRQGQDLHLWREAASKSNCEDWEIGSNRIAFLHSSSDYLRKRFALPGRKCTTSSRQREALSLWPKKSCHNWRTHQTNSEPSFHLRNPCHSQIAQFNNSRLQRFHIFCKSHCYHYLFLILNYYIVINILGGKTKGKKIGNQKNAGTFVGPAFI